VFTIVQLTDPHIGSSWQPEADTSLEAAVASVNRIIPNPDAVIVTGDIVNTPKESEYERARELLAELKAPTYLLPGNHDGRELLKHAFALPAGDPSSLSYAADLGPVRLIALDTQYLGHDGAQLDQPRLDWLEAALAEDLSTPTLLAMHHPPILSLIPEMDTMRLAPDERDAFAAIIARNPQVALIVAGHVHRTIFGMLGSTPVVVLSSTVIQLALTFAEGRLRFDPEPPSFAVHVLQDDGRFLTHIQPV
jgi:3',5'-cyclic-AMP phosphodiesterase